jgi:hypothetical protein
MTVKEFWASKEKKVRCQAVFRPESTSWAAFLKKNDDGMPYLFDCGGMDFHAPSFFLEPVSGFQFWYFE